MKHPKDLITRHKHGTRQADERQLARVDPPRESRLGAILRRLPTQGLPSASGVADPIGAHRHDRMASGARHRRVPAPPEGSAKQKCSLSFIGTGGRTRAGQQGLGRKRHHKFGGQPLPGDPNGTGGGSPVSMERDLTSTWPMLTTNSRQSYSSSQTGSTSTRIWTFWAGMKDSCSTS